MKKIIVHCGISVEDMCGNQLHPVTEVKAAILLVDTFMNC